MIEKKQTDKNNVTIALNVLYVEKDKIYSAYVSKQHKSWINSYSGHDSKCRRMALSCSKKISVLLNGIM